MAEHQPPSAGLWFLSGRWGKEPRKPGRTAWKSGGFYGNPRPPARPGRARPVQGAQREIPAQDQRGIARVHAPAPVTASESKSARPRSGKPGGCGNGGNLCGNDGVLQHERVRLRRVAERQW